MAIVIIIKGIFHHVKCILFLEIVLCSRKFINTLQKLQFIAKYVFIYKKCLAVLFREVLYYLKDFLKEAG